MVINDEISGGHARALLSIEDPNLQYETAGKVFEDKLSVRETEKLVRTILKGDKSDAAKQKKVLEDETTYKAYEKNLISLTGSKVEIQRKDNNKGKIVIEYNTLDEFEKIYDIILKGGKQ
jgi:ParB family chromosome partitioning protein